MTLTLHAVPLKMERRQSKKNAQRTQLHRTLVELLLIEGPWCCHRGGSRQRCLMQAGTTRQAALLHHGHSQKRTKREEDIPFLKVGDEQSYTKKMCTVKVL